MEQVGLLLCKTRKIKQTDGLERDRNPKSLKHF